MAKCVKLKRTKTQVCVGNLSKYIEIYERRLKSPLDSLSDSPDYRDEFFLLYNVWAMLETPKGKNIFDKLGIDKAISTIFYIRYLPNITSQNWVAYNGNRYDIVRVADLEENNLFLKLECIITGSVNKEGSKK